MHARHPGDRLWRPASTNLECLQINIDNTALAIIHDLSSPHHSWKLNKNNEPEQRRPWACAGLEELSIAFIKRGHLNHRDSD
ncbi:hypothetical protein MVEG_03182 [Podila verticillata NRRL 6337]|nr:hypothetical protein MVEG_03182 [Podila verticillata NRRL 6337]